MVIYLGLSSVSRLNTLRGECKSQLRGAESLNLGGVYTSPLVTVRLNSWIWFSQKKMHRKMQLNWKFWKNAQHSLRYFFPEKARLLITVEEKKRGENDMMWLTAVGGCTWNFLCTFEFQYVSCWVKVKLV